MAVVAIVAILAALAIGFGSKLGTRHRLKEMTREVFNVLSVARAEATRRSTSVWVAVEVEQITAFIDGNGNDAYDSDEEAVYQFPGPADSPYQGISMTATFGLVGTIPTAIFDSRGFSRDTSNNLQDGTVTIVEAVTGESFMVHTAISGAIRIQP